MLLFFFDFVSEAWTVRLEIKKTVKETLKENQDFAEKVKKLQAKKIMKKKWFLLKNIEKIKSVFFV